MQIINHKSLIRIGLILFFSFPLVYLLIQRAVGPQKENPKSSSLSQTVETDALQRAKNNALLNPSHDTFLELGLQYYNHKQFQECILATEKAIEYNPNSHLAYNNLCAAYNSLGLWDKGIEACQKALLISPDFQLAKNNLAWAIQEKEKK